MPFDNEQDAAEAADNGRNTGGRSYYRSDQGRFSVPTKSDVARTALATHSAGVPGSGTGVAPPAISSPER